MKKFLLLILFMGAAASAQENYATAWNGHKFVIVNSITAGIGGPVVKFPLLVRLDSTNADIFTQAKAGGIDVRFTKTDNTTRLPHQIESWNATTKTAAIWVLVDTIPAHRNNIALRMHWGNAAAADSSVGTQVFDTSNAFQAVWHMAGTTNESDATVNSFTATQSGSPASASGVVGAGRMVSDGNYFRAMGTATGKLNFPEGGDYTISAWVNSPSLPGAGTIVSKHDNAYALKLNAESSSWEFFEFGTDATTPGWNYVNAPTEGDLGIWKHLTGVHSSSGDVALYVNGLRMDGGPSTATSTAARVVSRDVVIGAQPAASNTEVQRPFDGTLDEVRMSSVAREPDFILLDYETQKSGSTVTQLMDAIPAPLAPLAHLAESRGDFSVESFGNGLRFHLDGASATKARITVLDMRGLTVSDRLSVVNAGVTAWQGHVRSGQRAPQGFYAVRITLLNAQGESMRVLEKKVLLMR